MSINFDADFADDLGDETEPRANPALNNAALQAWVERAASVPGLTAVRASIELKDFASDVSLLSGPAELLGQRDGAVRRRPWSRAARTPERRNREVIDAEGHRRGRLTVEFAAREDSHFDESLADLFTDSLLATLTSTLAVDTLARYRRRLVHAREAWYESSLAFETAFEESIIGMAVVALGGDEPGRLVRVNDRLCHVTGYPSEQLLTRQFVELMEPEDRRPQESAFRRALSGRRSPFRSDGRFRRDDGSMIWIRITAAPLMDQVGEPTYLLVQVEGLDARESVQVQTETAQDELTGLLNPGAFTEAITPIRDRARRTDAPAAVYVAQIDQWAEIVETYGEKIAREIQQQLADRLRAVLRVDDVIGRLSENEFAFAAEEISAQDAASLAARIGAALSKSHTIDGRDIALHVALGAAMVGNLQLTPAELVHHARQAAARAKGHPRGELLYSSYEIEVDDSAATPQAPAEAAERSVPPRIYRHRRR